MLRIFCIFLIIKVYFSFVFCSDSFRESCRAAARAAGLNPHFKNKSKRDDAETASTMSDGTSIDDSSTTHSSNNHSTTTRHRSRATTLLEMAVLNSRVTLESRARREDSSVAFDLMDQPDMVPSGDATELGLYRYFSALIPECTGRDIEEFRSERPKVCQIIFCTRFIINMILFIHLHSCTRFLSHHLINGKCRYIQFLVLLIFLPHH